MNTADIFQAIADPSRRQILMMLTKDSMTINSIADNFDMSRPAISKHVKMLEHCGFVMIQDVGRERYCSLNKQGFAELHEWLDHYDSFWKEKVGKLGALLNERHPTGEKKKRPRTGRKLTT